MNFAKFHTRGGRGLHRAHPGIEVPLPPGTGRVPERGRYRAARCAVTPGRRGYRGTPGRGGYPAAGGVYRARRGLPVGRATSGTLRGARWARLPGAGVYGRRATGRNRRLSGAHGAATRRRDYPGQGAAGYLYPGGGAVPGRLPISGAPPERGAAAQPYPRRGRLPGGLPGQKMLVFRAAGDGYTPLLITVDAYPSGATPVGYRAAGAEIFFHGRLPGKTPGSAFTRVYRKPFSGAAAGILFRQNYRKMIVLFVGLLFFGLRSDECHAGRAQPPR